MSTSNSFSLFQILQADFFYITAITIALSFPVEKSLFVFSDAHFPLATQFLEIFLFVDKNCRNQSKLLWTMLKQLIAIFKTSYTIKFLLISHIVIFSICLKLDVSSSRRCFQLKITALFDFARIFQTTETSFFFFKTFM